MRSAAAALAAFIAAAVPAAAQHSDMCGRDAAGLVAQVRAAIDRYSDVHEAIADGYRRVGEDFPGMGEHWISLREATLDRFDPARPQILLYVNAGGARYIVGAAFTALQDPGEPMPGPAFLHSQWHEHSGTLDDELFAVDHAGHDATDRFRVLVLHVWTRWAHAGDEFNVENWNLPFRRAAVAPPSAPDIVLARAVSLARSTGYYATALHRLGVPRTESDRARLHTLLTTSAAEVQRILGAHDTRRSWTAAERAGLKNVWQRLVRDVRTAWPATASQLPAFDRVPPAASLCT